MRSVTGAKPLQVQPPISRIHDLTNSLGTPRRVRIGLSDRPTELAIGIQADDWCRVEGCHAILQSYFVRKERITYLHMKRNFSFC